MVKFQKGRLNIPASELPIEETDEEIIAGGNIQWQVFRIMSEFVEGFDFLSKYEKSVSIFGSTRLKQGNKYYDLARELGKRVAEAGYAVVTGGGPGIMEAANRGASDAGAKSVSLNSHKPIKPGDSVGLNIELPTEQRINPYVTHSRAFRFFFTRKAMLCFAAETYVFFPGGIGTFDELFDILELIQCKKIMRVPVILFGSEFWQPFIDDFYKKTIMEKFGLINPDDFKLHQISDSIDEILEIVKKAPIRKFSASNLSRTDIADNNGT